jgi:long-chain fatty acid transport protein
MNHRALLASLFVLLLAGAHSIAYANAYKILCVRSVRATAMGEAFVAQADDASAVAFNPAGLAQLRDSRLSLQGTLCDATTEHESPSGDTTDSEDEWQLVPSFFATTDLKQENLGLGFGVTVPNGISSRWGDDSFARYVDTYSDLQVVDIGPAVGVRLADRWLLGAGLDYYYSKATLKRMVDFGAASGAPGTMDVESTLEGSGSAWGFNVGAIFEVNPRHRLAATYRYPYQVEYDGDLSVAGQRSDLTATIDFPTVVVLGYAYMPTDKWTFEFDLDWTEWERVGDIHVDMDDPNLPDSNSAEDLENTFAYKLGAQYAYSDRLDLRCGYIYNENATPDSTFRPSLPDTDMHFLTTGFGYEIGRVTIDTALQVVIYETRTVNNNVDLNETYSSSSVDGTYRTLAFCGSLAATYQF